MRNFQDTFETCKRSFVSAFSICITVTLKPSRTSMMELFCENNYLLKVVNYFRKGTPSQMFDWKYASGLSYLQRIPHSSQNNRVLTFEYTRVKSPHIDLNFTFTSYKNDTVFSMLTLDNTTFSQPGHILRHTGKRAIIFEKGQYRKMYKNM